MHFINALIQFVTRPSEENIERVIRHSNLPLLAAAYQCAPQEIENELWNVMSTAAVNAPYEGLLGWHFLYARLTEILHQPGLSHDVLFMLSKFSLPLAGVVFTIHNERGHIRFHDKLLINCTSAHVLPDGTVGINGTDLRTYLYMNLS